MAVYDPALMLQGDSLSATSYMVIKAVFAVALWGCASIGHFRMSMTWWERLLAFVAGVCLILALPVSDEVGFALGIAVLGWHVWRSRTTAEQRV